jgi:C4-dicarboxylate transporter, DctM subunit
MQILEALILSLFLFGVLSLGVSVAITLVIVGIVGLIVLTTAPLGPVISTAVWGSTTTWTLAALPLFIWMGEILFRTRLSEDMFTGLTPWVNRLPGGLLHVNNVGSGIFAAVSGSSAVTAATIGRISLPELRSRGYPDRLSVGTLAGAATLGLLIPPSLTLIVYGVTINESISKLFIAGILPGLVLSLMFMGYVAVWALLRPDQVPPEPRVGLRERLGASRFLIPVLLLVLVVIGSMYLGFATATEAAAFGVIGALVLAAAQGSLTAGSFLDSLMGATRTSAMIALILAGSAFLSLAMGFTGLPRAVASAIAAFDLTNFELLMVLLVFYIIVGCFLDGISAVVLTMAIVEPMIREAGIDVIWFGIFVVVVVEMAQITPPVGFNLFVLQGMTGRDMAYIARAALPMFLIMVVMVFVLIVFPDLATWLPENMRQSAAG